MAKARGECDGSFSIFGASSGGDEVDVTSGDFASFFGDTLDSVKAGLSSTILRPL